MTGDEYHVFYSEGAGTIPIGVHDTWARAKEERNEKFFADRKVRAAWVMRCNPSLNLRPELWGFTLRRNKHEAARA